MHLSQKGIYKLTIVLIVCLQLILAFQGFDVCDDGFVLTGYQQIFNAPESVEYNFVYWLSTIIGGLFYQLFPSGGVLWFKILAIFLNTGTFVLAYKLLKDYIRPTHALIGLSIVLFVNDFGFLVFYHNQLTAFFSVWIAYLMHRGIIRKQLLLLFFCGLLVGFNVFTRLPNLTLIILVFSIPFIGYLKKEDLINSLKPSLYFLIGVMSGLIFIILLMMVMGHLGTFYEAVGTLFSLGSTRGSGHSLVDLIHVFLFNYKKVFFYLSAFLVFSAILIGIRKIYDKYKFLELGLSVLAFIIYGFFFDSGGIYAIYALAFLGLAIILWQGENSQLKLLAFPALLIMVCLPIGSGGGIKSSGYMCIWLAVPIAIHSIAEIGNVALDFSFDKNDVSLKFPELFKKKVFLIMILAFFTIKFYNISKEAYFDPGSRLKKTFSINHPLAKAVYTTKERAEVINDLLPHLNKYVNPNDYLLAFDNIPMVHFLTKTKPYMYNPWVMIYDEHSFKEKLLVAEIDRDKLPIVVQQKFQSLLEFSVPMPNYLDGITPTGLHYNQTRTKAMIDFLDRNKYYIIWSNDYFNIYKSEKASK